MMKRLALLLVFALAATLSFAQKNERKAPQTALFVEALGQSVTFSFNFDTRFTKSSEGIGGRIGVGGWKIGENGALTVPVGLNYLIGGKGKYFEAGVGVTFTDTDLFSEYEEDGMHALGTLDFGFRLQPEDGGFSFRAGITPIFRGGTNSYFIPWWGGVSLGYAF